MRQIHTVDGELAVNVELAVGAVQEPVEGTAKATAIETTDATLSGMVSQAQLRDLPLNGRSIDSLALLSPGVFANRAYIPSASESQGLRISVNGGRPEANLYLLDGVVVNDHSGYGGRLRSAGSRDVFQPRGCAGLGSPGH
jgi:hypothetical protein